MKTLIVQLICSVLVLLSSFGLQSCKKESDAIAPANTSIIGKWKNVNSTRTLEREFIQGESATSGTGIATVTTNSTTPDNSVTTTTSPFTWRINGNNLAISNIADVDFIFEITADGKRLILFDSVNTNQVSFIFERVR